MTGAKIADGGGGITSPAAQVEEYVGVRLDWAGWGGLRPEVGDGLTADGILLIVEGDKNLCGIAEMPSRGVPRKEKVSGREHKVHRGTELDRPAVAGALRVFEGPET